MTETPPLILTLHPDPDAFALLDGLRRAHFPPERNFLSAHLTLFHALPGDEEEAVTQALETLCAATPPPRLAFPRVRSLGRGVAVEVECPEVTRLRRRLADAFAPWLGAQDRQGFRPHVTIQNKVTPEAARQLHALLSAAWVPFAGRGESLRLWRYLGGPWELLQAFPFTP